MNLDPRIGTLNNGTYYAFVNGYGKPETRGTLAEVELALGIRVKVAAPATAKRQTLHAYTVTVTPTMTTYGSHGTSGEYTVELTARTAAEAIKQAREQRRDVEGRYGVPATFHAKRST